MQNSSTRTLIIHAGGIKTGSSALQTYLELNADRLQECGIDYHLRTKITHKYQITSGNGSCLYRDLRSNASSNILYENIETYFEKNNTAICSCEDFQHMTKQQWEVLLDHTNNLGIKIHLVFFIRDVASYFTSHYDHMIKRHGFPADLFSYMDQRPWTHFQFLHKIESLKDRIEIRVIRYDPIKNQSINKFIEFLDLKEQLPVPDSDFVVNRSLSKMERILLVKLNKKMGEKFSTSLSERMLYAAPLKAVDRTYNPDFLDLLKERFTDDVAWVNQRFFAGQPIVKIIDEASLEESKSQAIIDEGTQVHDLVLDWAFDQIFKLEKKQLKMQNSVIKDKDQQIAEQNLKIETLLNSISWKLTAPLRRFADYLRKIKSFLKPQPTKAPSSQA